MGVEYIMFCDHCKEYIYLNKLLNDTYVFPEGFELFLANHVNCILKVFDNTNDGTWDFYCYITGIGVENENTKFKEFRYEKED